MKKKIAKIKIQIKACEANPSPPIGPALGSKGINIMKFCNDFNDFTKKNHNFIKGSYVTTIINIYSDKSFDFVVKSQVTSIIIKEILSLNKGSSFPNKNKVAKINYNQLKEIALKKNNDIFVNSEEAAIKTVIGTARSMGIEIDGVYNEKEKL